MGSVESVQCLTVPCSGLYLFSRSIVFKCTVAALATRFSSVVVVTSGVVPPSLFILVSSVCKSLQCLISTLT